MPGRLITSWRAATRGGRPEDERDRKLWLETLGKACEKTGWRIHAWVMMNNHYHLLLETPEPNLVAGMKWLQGIHPALGLILALPVSAIVTWVLLPSAKRDSNLWKFDYLCSMNTAPEPVRFDVDKLKPVLHDKIECIDGRHLALLNRHQSLVTSAAT